jgi:YfiH family protein
MGNIDLIQPQWNAHKNVKAFSTTRYGGVSHGKYQSLNLGLHVGDDPNLVQKNRSLLPNNQHIGWLNQTHSVDVVELDGQSVIPLNADASYTSLPKQICAVMTADCLPILLCNIDGTEVAAIHAGWRGLASGIVENTLATLSSKPKTLLAWLGPAIGAKSFEVGEDVLRCFDDNEKNAFGKHHKQGKYWLDLHDLAIRQLNACGVTDITQYKQCTFTNDDFFSYRRDGVTGRMATCIWIEQ